MHNNFKRLGALSVAAALVASSVAPAYAGILTSKSVQLSNQNLGSTGVNYKFTVDPSSTTAIQQIWIDFGTAEDGTGAITGFSTAAATQAVTGLGTGWVIDNTGSANHLVKLTNTTAQAAPAGTTAFTIDLGALTNSSVAGTYKANITTFSDAGTTQIDADPVSFVNQNSSVTVTGSLGQTLTFALSATAVSLGTLNPDAAVSTGTPSITTTVSTNAANGYDLYVAGNTLTNGNAQTIPFVADGSVTGSVSEFGISVTGGGAAFANDQGFAAQTKIAGRTAPISGDAHVVTYKADVSATQAPGTYTSVSNYVATGRF